MFRVSMLVEHYSAQSLSCLGANSAASNSATDMQSNTPGPVYLRCDDNSSHKYSASKKALTPQNNCGVSFFSMSFIGIRLLRTQQKALLGRRPVGQGDVISLTSKLPSDLTQP